MDVHVCPHCGNTVSASTCREMRANAEASSWLDRPADVRAVFDAIDTGQGLTGADAERVRVHDANQCGAADSAGFCPHTTWDIASEIVDRRRNDGRATPVGSADRPER